MRSMISTFLGAHHDPTPSPQQSYCNYLHSEIQHLEERDFLTFRNDAVKLLSEIQYKAEERKRQVTTNQQATTFQLPQATQATGEREYILTIPETQTVSIPVVQPTQTSTGEPVTVIAKVQQPPRPSSSSPSTQPVTSYVVVDDQQPGPSRQMIYNSPSVAPSQPEEIIQYLCGYSKCSTVSADRHTTATFTLSTSTSTFTSAIYHSSRTVKTSQPVQPAQSESAQISGLVHTRCTKPGPFKGHPNLPKTINNCNVSQKQKSTPSNIYTSPTVQKKTANYVNECVNVKQIQTNFQHKTKEKF